MYILVVGRGYPSESYKMNGIFEFDQASALAEAGHKVVFCAVDSRSFRRKRKFGYESFIKDGVNVEVLNIPVGGINKKTLHKINHVFFKRLYNKIFKKYGKPDLVHAHFIGPSHVVTEYFSKNEKSIPVIVSEHSSSINKKDIDPYYLEIGMSTYHKADKVISVSSHLATEIKEKFNIDSVILPNVVDTNFVYNKEDVDRNEKFLIVSVGRLVREKGMDKLIRAFDAAYKESKNVELYIYGSGPEKDRLEKMISEKGLKNQVFLEGLVDRKEIANQMANSNCFALASELETFGVAYIEALAMGLPVISTECGGPEDFIDKANGVLVPLDDQVALQDALIYMYRNSDNYDRELLRNDVIEKFSYKKIASDLLEVYKLSILDKDK